MSNQNTNNETENPVGPETPMFHFDVPLWQVFAALFFIACLLTCWKMYERHWIAPTKQVQWESFDVDSMEQDRHQRRQRLFWVESMDSDVNERIRNVLDEIPVRVAVYNQRCQCLVITRNERTAEVEDWLVKNLPEIFTGGFASWSPSEKKADAAKGLLFDSQTIANLIEGYKLDE